MRRKKKRERIGGGERTITIPTGVVTVPVIMQRSYLYDVRKQEEERRGEESQEEDRSGGR